jgi:hypothetical protein
MRRWQLLGEFDIDDIDHVDNHADPAHHYAAHANTTYTDAAYSAAADNDGVGHECSDL